MIGMVMEDTIHTIVSLIIKVRMVEDQGHPLIGGNMFFLR